MCNNMMHVVVYSNGMYIVNTYFNVPNCACVWNINLYKKIVLFKSQFSYHRTAYSKHFRYLKLLHLCFPLQTSLSPRLLNKYTSSKWTPYHDFQIRLWIPLLNEAWSNIPLQSELFRHAQSGYYFHLKIHTFPVLNWQLSPPPDTTQAVSCYYFLYNKFLLCIPPLVIIFMNIIFNTQ